MCFEHNEDVHVNSHGNEFSFDEIMTHRPLSFRAAFRTTGCGVCVTNSSYSWSMGSFQTLCIY